MRLRRPFVAIRRALPVAIAVACIAAALPTRARAQAGLSHIENAVPVPRGMVRLRVAPSWTRWDSRFTGTGSATEPLGAVFTADTLGTAQLPALTTLESALRSLTGNPDFRLSLGHATAFGSVRVVTTPISLEYGVTRWLSLGVTVPIVQRQRELVIDLTATGDSAGNVGPTAANIDPAVHAQAAQIAQEIDAAALQLSQRIVACEANPATSGCEAINADPAGASAAVAEGVRVATSIRYIYGTAAGEGFGLVPVASLTAEIAQRLQDVNARFATYLGGTPVPTQTPPRGAAGAAAAGDLRTLARRGVAGIGPDSLGRINTIGIGDVEVGARVLLFDSRRPRPAADTTVRIGPRLRVLLGGLARFATGEPPVDDELFSVGGGDGQMDAEGSVAVDVESGARVGATVVARYTAQLGEVAATRMPDERGHVSPFSARGVGTRKLGNIFALDVSPRVWLGNSLHLAGHYGLRTRADDEYSFPRTGVDDAPILPGVPPLPETGTAGGYTEHRVGAGVTYSTVADWEAGRARVPVEVSYSHTETIRGNSALVPRAGRDQIQIRFYYRLFR